MTTVVTALVLEVGPDHLLVATPDRRFLRVPRPAGAGAVVPAVGEIIGVPIGAPVEARARRWPAPWTARLARPLALAAALALAVAGSFAGLRAARWWTAAAVVAVDINPSVELAVAGDQRVTAVRGVDPEGRALVAGAPVVGRAVADAVKMLVAQAARSGFVRPDGTGLVLVAVAPQKAEPPVTPQALRDAAVAALKEAGVPGLVAAHGLDRAAVRAARKAGLRLNGWVIKQAAAAAGLEVADDDLKRDPAGAARKAAGKAIRRLVPAAVPVFDNPDDEGDEGGKGGAEDLEQPGPGRGRGRPAGKEPPEAGGEGETPAEDAEPDVRETLDQVIPDLDSELDDEDRGADDAGGPAREGGPVEPRPFEERRPGRGPG